MKVEEFLNKHLINPDLIDMEKLCSYIINEMKTSLDGKKSSMPMINSYCSPSISIHGGDKVAVIDAGGTNFRTCLVIFNENGEPEISDFRKTLMPGSKTEVTSEQFFSIIADEVERLIDKTDKIGFCFSYAAKILPNHDGVPLVFSKEIKAPEVIGKHLGAELFKELSKRGHDMSSKKIIILNDTVTTLLAGLSATKTTGCEGCIGFILGTGTNCAYMEKDTIINEESGSLDISLGDIDKEFLASTNNPDSYKFEKMISGAYLGKSCRFVIKHAMEEGVLSGSFVVPEQLTTTEMGCFIDGKESPFDSASDSDRKILEKIVKSFIFRAAKLTATSLAASVLITEYGKTKPVLINADGTTFYKTKYLKDMTEKYLNDFLSEKGRSAKFIQIENSPTLGSAIGALSL